MIYLFLHGPTSCQLQSLEGLTDEFNDTYITGIITRQVASLVADPYSKLNCFGCLAEAS